MKRFAAILLLMILVLCATASAEEFATYEDIVFQRRVGQVILVEARGERIDRNRNEYRLKIRCEDGSYKCVNPSNDKWVITLRKYIYMSKDTRDALKYGKPLILTLEMRKGIQPNFLEISSRDAYQKQAASQRYNTIDVNTVLLIISILALGLGLLICFVYIYKAYRKKHPKPVPVSTRILNASRSFREYYSSMEVLGRMALGDMVAGDLGALAFAQTARPHRYEDVKVIFLVRYDNGKNKVETVDAYSDKCQRYLAILEDPPRVRE